MEPSFPKISAAVTGIGREHSIEDKLNPFPESDGFGTEEQQEFLKLMEREGVHPSDPANGSKPVTASTVTTAHPGGNATGIPAGNGVISRGRLFDPLRPVQPIAGIDPITTSQIEQPAMKDLAIGDAILRGLAKMRGFADEKIEIVEKYLTTEKDAFGVRQYDGDSYMHPDRLFAIHASLTQYSVFFDLLSKVVSKTTQTIDTLQKG